MELPEVELIVRDIKSIEGYKVIFNNLLNDVNFKTPFYDLKDSIIEEVKRHGKYLIIKFDKTALVISLSNSGLLFIDSGEAMVPEHCAWLLQLDNGLQLRFVNVKFKGRGIARIWHYTKEEYEKFLNRCAPEIWDINPESFVLLTKQSKYQDKTIKELLLEQKFIAGIGNIYASEICYEAFINPFKLVSELNDKQIENIYYCIKRVLERAIRNKCDFNALKVYKKQECFRCKREVVGETSLTYLITRESLKGRMTYFCGNCQK